MITDDHPSYRVFDLSFIGVGTEAFTVLESLVLTPSAVKGFHCSPLCLALAITAVLNGEHIAV